MIYWARILTLFLTYSHSCLSCNYDVFDQLLTEGKIGKENTIEYSKEGVIPQKKHTTREYNKKIFTFLVSQENPYYRTLLAKIYLNPYSKYCDIKMGLRTLKSLDGKSDYASFLLHRYYEKKLYRKSKKDIAKDNEAYKIGIKLGLINKIVNRDDKLIQKKKSTKIGNLYIQLTTLPSFSSQSKQIINKLIKEVRDSSTLASGFLLLYYKNEKNKFSLEGYSLATDIIRQYKAEKYPDPYMSYILACLYLEGIAGYSVDINKAYYYLKKSIKSQFSPSTFLFYRNYKFFSQHNIKDLEKDPLCLLMKSAELGYAPAQYVLANHYNVTKNKRLFYYWLTKSAKQSYIISEQLLGRLYMGEENEKDINIKKAKFWLRKSAKYNCSRSQYCLGKVYHVEKNYKKAFQWYMSSSKQHYPPALKAIADYFYEGIWVDKDYHIAAEYYQKAAKFGDSESSEMLLLLNKTNIPIELNHNENIFDEEYNSKNKDSSYSCGEDLYQNGCYAESVKYLKKAADMGHIIAQHHLGWRYFWGCGVDKNLSKGIHWFKESSKNGNIRSQYVLGRLYAVGYGVPECNSTSTHYFTLAAKRGCVRSMYQLGEIFTYGYGLPIDLESAIFWLTKAVERNCSKSMVLLGEVYLREDNEKKNYERAYILFNRASKHGNALADLILGNLYFEGKIVEKNYDIADCFFRKAAFYDVDVALCRIAELYSARKNNISKNKKDFYFQKFYSSNRGIKYYFLDQKIKKLNFQSWIKVDRSIKKILRSFLKY